MQFTRFRRKKFANFKNPAYPFPPIDVNPQIVAVFTGISVECSDQSQFRLLYDHGCYGKGSNSRGAPLCTSGEESLVLSLEEAFFLSYILKVLRICNLKREELSWDEYLRQIRLTDPKTELRISAYLYLKAKNWIVKSGIKFGGDFLIYKAGPSYFHASFLVVISAHPDYKHFVTKHTKGLQRIAETSDKDVLLLEITQPSNFKIESMDDFQKLRISETIIERFNYTSFVQQRQQQQQNQQWVNK